MTDDVVFSTEGASALIVMNRPDALNALTLGMVRAMVPQLRTWANDDGVSHILIEGAGARGFCAGGDIRALHDWGRANAPEATGILPQGIPAQPHDKDFPETLYCADGRHHYGRRRGRVRAWPLSRGDGKHHIAMPETGIGLLPMWAALIFATPAR